MMVIKLFLENIHLEWKMQVCYLTRNCFVFIKLMLIHIEIGVVIKVGAVLKVGVVLCMCAPLVTPLIKSCVQACITGLLELPTSRNICNMSAILFLWQEFVMYRTISKVKGHFNEARDVLKCNL